MQWTPSDNTVYQSQGLLSPDQISSGNYGPPSATYSFTADFRPQSQQQFMQQSAEPQFICTR
jgi:hypothetical protein